MKGLLKVRLSRKLVFILGGVIVLTGTTGAAAVYIGADTLLGPSYKQLNGMECTEVNTVTIKKKDRFWVRKYITTEPTDGVTRVKTALRVASAVYEAQKPDLVQVVVLDKNGPSGRADMRGRAVGADVVYIADPSRVPEEAQAAPYTARYVDKAANASGQFYGDKINLPLPEIELLLASLDDKTDCIKPEVVLPEGHAAPSGHGEAPAKGHGEAAPAHGEAAPAHGEASPAHGEAPAGHGEDVPVAAEGESKGWMASLKGLVGLGGEEAPAESAHGAAAAPAESHGEIAPTEGHGDAEAAKPVADTAHGEADAAKPHDGGHAAEGAPATEAPVEQAAAVETHETTADTPAADTQASAAGADWLAKLRAKPIADANAAAAKPEAIDVPAEDSDVLPPKASDKAFGEKHAAATH